jgi:WhiB family redox-sensing transcriptional regulator
VHDGWQTNAACRGPLSAIFFPPNSREQPAARAEREARARAICERCPVREPCLAYALRIREPHGIWGGLDERERAEMLADRT